MRYSRVLVFIMGLALTVSLSTLGWAESSHTGKLVSAGDGKLTMTDAQGQHQHTHEIPADATITCGGKPCTLGELKPGSTVTVSMDKKGDQTVITKVSVAAAE